MRVQFYLLFLLTILASCGGGGGGGSAPPGGDNANLEALTSNTEILPGQECPYGGRRIAVGIDRNNDGVLQEDEETSVEVICSSSADVFNGLIIKADKTTNDVYDLYRVYDDGSGLTRIDTEGALGSVSYALVSPDKRKIAYTKGQGATTSLYIASLVDNSDPVPVPNQPADRYINSFAWSPDGSYLAYVADHGVNAGEQIVYIVTSAGAGRQRLSLSSLISAGTISWAPNGSRLAYQGTTNASLPSNLYTVFTNGTGSARINGNMISGSRISEYSWAPDSSRIAYVSDQEAINAKEIFTSLPNGNGLVKASGTVTASGNLRGVVRYGWSPDSSRIAFYGDMETDNDYELYTVNPDGTNRITATGAMRAGGDVHGFSWAMDSSRLAYLASQDKSDIELFTVTPSGSTESRTKVNRTTVANGDIVGFQWSPDNSRIAYFGDRDVTGVRELFTANVDGSNQARVNGTMPNTGDVFDYKWSPDSSMLAYRSNESGEFTLYVCLPDGTSKSTIVSGLLSNKYYWSADNSSILYGTSQPDQSFFEIDLYITTDFGQTSQLISGPIVTGRGVQSSSIVWVE